MFVAYERLLRQWVWVYPGGSEKIAEPPHIFVDEEWAKAHTLPTPRPKSEHVKIRRGKRPAQMQLEL